MQRRRFMETCSGALLCSTLAETALAAGAAGAPRQYQRTRLMDETGAPLRASEIPPRRNLVFAYPYVATPAFLLNLGFTIIEIIGGLWTNSIAILTDALHDSGDCASLGLAWYFD